MHISQHGPPRAFPIQRWTLALSSPRPTFPSLNPHSPRPWFLFLQHARLVPSLRLLLSLFLSPGHTLLDTAVSPYLPLSSKIPCSERSSLVARFQSVTPGPHHHGCLEATLLGSLLHSFPMAQSSPSFFSTHQGPLSPPQPFMLVVSNSNLWMGPHGW